MIMCHKLMCLLPLALIALATLAAQIEGLSSSQNEQQQKQAGGRQREPAAREDLAGSGSGAAKQATAAKARAIGPQGIVVPKRSAIISGLNHQFRNRNTSSKTSGGNSHNVSSSGEIELPAAAANPTPSASKGLFPVVNWLGNPLGSVTGKRRKEESSQQQPQVSQPQQNLYLDRYQQQLLAANPALLNPAAPNNLSAALLLTRADVNLSLSGGLDQHLAQGLSLQGLNMPPLNPGSAATSGGSLRHQLQQLTSSNSNGGSGTSGSGNGEQSNQQQQLYRGFSLIELELKSEADRRYVQDLYGNLTAAINEQAQNPSVSSVSPYVDVDFWSFKYALNDRIDIMVSPKSRAFMLGQLARAKIKHRIKIDDIQSRLDQQSAAPVIGPAASGAISHQSDQLQAMGKSADSGAGPALTARGGSRSDLNGRQAPEGGSSVAIGAGSGQPQAQSRPLNDSSFFENYQRLADITQYIEGIVERNADVAKVKVIGRSSQGRYLRVLKLGYDSPPGASELMTQHFASAPAADSGDAGRQPAAIDNAAHILESFFARLAASKKVGSIWLDGGTHAREWISPATTLYIAHRLADNHQRCTRFFEGMRQFVAAGLAQAQAQAQAAELSSSLGLGGTGSGSGQQVAGRASGPPPPVSVDPDLVPSINEINSSLLGGRPLPRQRSELERTMEVLAKSPQSLADEYSCSLDLDQLLRRYTFYLMPVLNPDGYEYSHTHNRLWRKTRSTSQHPIYRHFCLGADPNRNYDARHGSAGSSSHPCSQTYAGTVPFTEPETRHQSNFVYANRHSLKMFISFHSYSQMILLPFSHSRQLAPDHKDLESVGQAAVRAIERTHGTVYRVGPSASILYTASGTASDWAYEKAGIKYSYTIELRDTGAFGFLLPKQQIVPTGEETFNGLLAMIEQMEKNDNLLTSKSLATSGSASNNSNSSTAGGSADYPVGGRHHQLGANQSLPVDYNHAPDPDQLRGQFGGPSPLSSPPRPPLENIIDGSLTWAAPSDPLPLGVRDRRPATGTGSGRDSQLVKQHREPLVPLVDQLSSASSASRQQAEMALAASGALELGGEGPLAAEAHHSDSDDEPDSGYAFEGEGELMEPTRDNVAEVARLSAELRSISGRRDHSRRIISQTTGLTSSGRNYINSPLLSGRQTTSAPRRESSDDLVGSPGNSL